MVNLSNLKIVFRDALQMVNQLDTNAKHCQVAMEWLTRAQDMAGGAGLSAGYHIKGEWLPPYPETTGYIISTFIDYASWANRPEYLDRAIRMGDWEIDIQLGSGAVRGGLGLNIYPIVFNTGQVMLGWLSLYQVTQDQKYLSAAIKAGDWLVSVQDTDGKWTQYTYNQLPHSYHSRVALPLLQLAKITGFAKYQQAGEKNIRWISSNFSDKKWIENMGFLKDEDPLTHTIAYTLDGLLESSYLLEENLGKEIQDMVFSLSEKIMHYYERKKHNPYATPKFLPARLNEKIKSTTNYSCLTGNAQIAIVWLRIYQMTNDARFLNSALKIIDQVKSTQSIEKTDGSIKGAVAGSYPIFGQYMRFIYPNWATSFLVDAIILQEKIIHKLESK